MSELENEIIQVLIKHKIINEESLRDFRIKQKYTKLRSEGLTGKEARILLAEEYFVSEKTIQHILYAKKKS